MTDLNEVMTKLNIRGLTKIVKPQADSTNKANRFETKSFAIDKFIFENYETNAEFLTSEISEFFKDKHSWTSSDLSGQFNAKKNNDYLSNREATDDEAVYIGNGTRVWHATDKFYEFMEEDMVKYAEWQSEGNLDTEEELAPEQSE